MFTSYKSNPPGKLMVMQQGCKFFTMRGKSSQQELAICIKFPTVSGDVSGYLFYG
jgi:hypothetical protein